VDPHDREAVRYRRLEAGEIGRVAEIDRTERIRAAYVQHGEQLEEIAVDWAVPTWFGDGGGEHSFAHQLSFVEGHVRAGAAAVGALHGDRLVGVGVVTPHLRPGIAQLAFLHVSDGYRGTGIGVRLAQQLEEIARAAGDTEMVVSATPSRNTVRFYLNRGYAPTGEPLPELLELEPEDVHLRKAL
jgi:GNAT superfamily N-acetyltransferase